MKLAQSSSDFGVTEIFRNSQATCWGFAAISCNWLALNTLYARRVTTHLLILSCGFIRLLIGPHLSLALRASDFAFCGLGYTILIWYVYFVCGSDRREPSTVRDFVMRKCKALYKKRNEIVIRNCRNLRFANRKDHKNRMQFRSDNG